MKKSKKLTPVVTRVNDKFLDIEKPQFDWIDVELEWVNTAMKNSDDEIVEQSNEFVVKFNLSKKMTSENKELSEEIKSITGMNFAPYRWQDKEYRFYTTKYNTRDDEHKKEVLNSLFEAIKDFELKRNKELELSSDAFKKDLNIEKSYNTDLLAMKFCKEKNTFVVITKGYIGKDAFRKIISSSAKTFKWGEEGTEQLPGDFFDDLNIPQLKNKMVFILNENGYLNVKELFEGEKAKVENFIKEQEKLIDNGLDISDLEYTQDNLFNFKIKFNDQKKCFEFYVKGYNTTYNQMKYEESFAQSYPSYGQYPSVTQKYAPTKKSILSMFSVNYICCEDNPDLSEEGVKITLDKQSLMYNKKFVMLDILKGSDAKSKTLYVPVTDHEKLRSMKQRFLKLNEIFSLPDTKVTCKSSEIPHLSDIPVVLFNKKLNPVLVYSSKRTGGFEPDANGLNYGLTVIHDYFEDNPGGGEKKKIKPYTATMIGKEITYQQAMYFLNDHELSNDIYKESLSVNAYFHGGDGMKAIDGADQQDIFNKILLMAKIHAENPEKIPKKKTMKI